MKQKQTFDASNVAKFAVFSMRTYKNTLIGWSVAIFGVMFLYMILFPSIQDMATMKMEAMPEELLQLVGMEDFNDMGNFVPYFGMIYNLVLVAISIFAAGFGCNLLAREEKSRRIEALSALPFTRTETYLAAVLTGFLGTLLVVTSAIVSTLICGAINGGETFILIDVVTIAKLAGFIPFFFLAFGLCLAGTLPKQANSYLGSGLVGMLYMLGYLSKLLGEDAAWLGYASPFETLRADAILAQSNETLLALGVYYAIFMVLLVLGGAVYRRRDLAV